MTNKELDKNDFRQWIAGVLLEEYCNGDLTMDSMKKVIETSKRIIEFADTYKIFLAKVNTMPCP